MDRDFSGAGSPMPSPSSQLRDQAMSALEITQHLEARLRSLRGRIAPNGGSKASELSGNAGRDLPVEFTYTDTFAAALGALDRCVGLLNEIENFA